MRRSVVVTFLGAIAACGGKMPPSETSEPPPAPEPAPAPAPAAPAPATTAPGGEHDRSAYTKVLNATDPTHGRIYRRQDATCYVNLPFPPQEGPPVSFRPPPQQDVACPPSMADPSWAECAYGTVQSTEDGSACLCMVMGNPPPPPRAIQCPVTEPRTE